MIQKKAQSQIITTVLIILLVLAAIVIVWQVVQTTIAGGAEQVEAQSECIGLTLEITQNALDDFTITRGAQGKSFTAPIPEIIVLVNGIRQVNGTGAGTNYQDSYSSFGEPFGSANVKFGANLAPTTDKLQAAYKISDDTTCPASAEFTVTA